MKKAMKIVMLSVFLLGINACTDLRSPHFVGKIQQPLKLMEGKMAKVSIWQYEDKIYHIRVIDSVNVMGYAMYWRNSMQNYKITSGPVLITRLDDHYFLNFKGEDSLYTPYLLKFTSAGDGSLAFVTAKEEFLKKQIAAGDSLFLKKLAGEIHPDYLFEGSKEEWDRFITTHINDLFPVGRINLLIPLAGYEGKPQTDRFP